MKNSLRIDYIGIAAIIMILAIAVSLVSSLLSAQKVEAAGVQGPSFLNASSTVFTLTTTSLQLLGTTTPQGQSGARVTATIQPINCTTGSIGGVYLNMNRDVVASAATGPFAFASTTLVLGDHVNQVPNVRGAVRGVVTTGTCTVIVTEWRTQ
jgi:hypothetical protein